MTNKRINAEIGNWTSLNFPNETRISIALGIAEETGELCRAVLKQFTGIRGTFEEWDEEIKKELGDVYIKLGHLANFCGWDLDELIKIRWTEISQRDWIKNPIGHGLPTDEPAAIIGVVDLGWDDTPLDDMDISSKRCPKCVGTVMIAKNLYALHLHEFHGLVSDYNYETEGLGGT